MSAYLVEYETIQKIVQFGSRAQYHATPTYYFNGRANYMGYSEADKIGSILWAENNRSVNHRYTESNETPGYQHQPLMRPSTPVEIIKACNCLNYQSCETADWDQTEAHAILDAIRERAIRELPGYDEAEWG